MQRKSFPGIPTPRSHRVQLALGGSGCQVAGILGKRLLPRLRVLRRHLLIPAHLLGMRQESMLRSVYGSFRVCTTA